MFCFAIVDDDKNVLSIISSFIKDYQKQKKILQIELKEYEFPDLFLKSYKKGDFQLIFLDIGMKPINGIQLAKEIRSIDNKVFFVFVSGHNQYFQYALNLHAFDYLLKPVMRNKFQRVLEDYFLHLHEVRYVESPIFTYSNKLNDISIETDSIFFIEQYRNKSIFITKFKNIEVYSTLKEILPKLPDNFGLCHKSYIVNMKYIMHRCKDKCILNNDNEIPIGRLKKNEFRDLYLNFLANSVKKHSDFNL